MKNVHHPGTMICGARTSRLKVFRRFFVLMGLGITAALGLGATAADSPDLHAFTDTQGHTLKAVIMNVTGKEVSLQREDGKTFPVKIDTFSKEDQAYIRQWALKQYTNGSAPVFKIAASTVKTREEVDKTQASAIVTSWDEGYALSLKNQTGLTFTNLRVDYVIFAQPAPRGAANEIEPPLQRLKDTLTLDEVAPLGEKVFAVKRVTLQKAVLKANYRWESGDFAPHVDQMKAVWLRFYDADNNFVQEWCSSTDLMKKETFDAPAASSRAARAAAIPENRGSQRGR